MPSSALRRKRKAAQQGHLASRRSDLYGAAVGAVVALLVFLAGAWSISEMQRAQTPTLTDSTQRLGVSVGRSVAQTIQLALGYGIPFDQIYDVQGYLEEVMSANAELAAIRIQNLQGDIAYSRERTIETGDKDFYHPLEVTVWIIHQGQRVGHVGLTMSGEATWDVSLHQYLLLIALTLLAGLATLMAVRILLVERWELPRSHLMASLSATARGNFSDFSKLPDVSPVTQVSHLAERARAPVRDRAREVSYLAEELKSIDLDGSLGRRVDVAVEEVERSYRFDRPQRLEADLWWPGWLNLLLVLVGTMTLPLIGGFAADRVGFNLLASSAATAALALEAIGGLLGLLVAVAWKCRGPLRRIVHGLSIVLAAGAIGVTYELHDLTPFLALRPVAGFAVFFTVFSVIQAPGRSLRGPWYCGMLLLAGLVIGPALGSLLADGFGRRLAFLVTGVLVLLVGLPLSFFTHPARRLRGGVRRIWRQSAMAAAGITACSGLLGLYVGAVIDRHDYALLGSFFGYVGVGFVLGLLLRRPALAPPALILAIVSSWLPYPVDAVLCGTLLFLGLAIGLQIAPGWRYPTGLTGLTAGLSGLILGPAVVLLALYLELSTPVWITILLAFPIVTAFVAGRPLRRRAGAE